jgi:citrate synthase
MWLTAEQAREALGVKSATLYAYVSRGLLRAQPSPHDPRQSLYSPDDIARLAHKKRAGRKRAEIAHSAIRWGEPVLESAITHVGDGMLFYRGQSAIALSQHGKLEDVFALLVGHSVKADPQSETLLTSQSGAVGALQFLASKAGDSLPSAGRNPQSLIEEATLLFDDFKTALSGVAGPTNAHEKLAQRWTSDPKMLPRTQDALRRTLVLLADHELNPSTFAARVAAGTGASLPACALAGLATLTGPLHGKAAIQSLNLIKASHSTSPDQALRSWLSSGQNIVGFGHALYPSGDPRAVCVIEALPLSPKSQRLLQHLAEAGYDQPNIDFALALLTYELGLPEEAPFLIFALARMVGWLAHAIEQSGRGDLIRPRAHYVGPKVGVLSA